MECALNDKNVSSTMGCMDMECPNRIPKFEIKPDWKFDDYFKGDFTVEELLHTLCVIEKFEKKFPNDEIITDFEKVVREEICNMFGGTIF